MSVSRARNRVAWLAVVVGVAVGVALPTGVVVTATHTVCVQGAALGSSGDVQTFQGVFVSPPGGVVAGSALEITTGWTNGSRWWSGFGVSGSSNGTWAMLGEGSWTLFAQSSGVAFGWGPAVTCSSTVLVPENFTPAGQGICACQIAGPVPGTVGTRVNLSWSYNASAPVNLADFAANYSNQPLGTFAYGLSSDENPVWAESAGLVAMGLTARPYYDPQDGVEGVGLSYSLPSGQPGMGIPIRLLNGSMTIVDTSDSQLDPSSTYFTNLTYVFPVGTDQGTWAVYGAGLGSPMSIGGFLFEKTSATAGPVRLG